MISILSNRLKNFRRQYTDKMNLSQLYSGETLKEVIFREVMRLDSKLHPEFIIQSLIEKKVGLSTADLHEIVKKAIKEKKKMHEFDNHFMQKEKIIIEWLITHAYKAPFILSSSIENNDFTKDDLISFVKHYHHIFELKINDLGKIDSIKLKKQEH